MSRKGRRKRLARNIYGDVRGISCVIRLRGHTEELRFPLGTPIPEIRRAEQRRRDILERLIPESAAAGSLQHAVDHYLTGLPEGAYQKERRALLAAWTVELGPELFAGLTSRQIQDVLAKWHKAGVSASRQNKRISALRVLWRRIAPDYAAPHPIERLSRVSDPDQEIDRAREFSLIAMVLEAVSDAGFAGKRQSRDQPSLAKVRLRALAWTGHPQSLLAKVQPEHVRWDATPPEMYIQPRRKGAGVGGDWIPLTPQGAAAMKELFRVGGHGGEWHRGVLRLAWQRAVKVTQAELRKDGRADEAKRLESMRVYDLRHSFLTALALASRDIHAVAAAARHSDLRTTARYMRGAASDNMKAAIKKLSEAMKDKI